MARKSATKDEQKNPDAVKLGKLAAGRPKKYSEEEIKRRTERLLKARFGPGGKPGGWPKGQAQSEEHVKARVTAIKKRKKKPAEKAAASTKLSPPKKKVSPSRKSKAKASAK